MACRWTFSVPVIALWALLSPGCDESLPPRTDPENVLIASLQPPHDVIEMSDGAPIRTAGSYIAYLKNSHDEALQKEADIRATITVFMAKSPHVRRTILVPPELAHPALDGRLLTLLPGDSARFLVVWDQKTDTGVPFWEYVPLTLVQTPLGDYYDSDPIEFVAQASIQVFDGVQPRTSPPIYYTSKYRLFETIDGND